MTKELISVVNDTVVNSETVRELIDKIAAAHCGCLITIILDNAKYQRCYYVIDYAKELGIELLFLPGYSPNLNLIERLWKFIKKKCLYSVYYADFKSFKAAIIGCTEDLATKYNEELKKFLTLNFQIFKMST